MSGIRAQWHLAELSAPDGDPFAAAVYSAGIEIDLSAPEDELHALLGRLLEREARLDGIGVRCGLKDGGQDCRSCPSATLDASEALSRLCRLGKDEMVVAEHVSAISNRRRLSLIEIARHADEWSELGHLDADLAELATAVGL